MSCPKSDAILDGDEQLLLQRSQGPDHIRDSVISATGLRAWKFPTVQSGRPSSLGKLDSLPLELLHECMIYLDLMSLARLCRVSLRGAVVVKSALPLRNYAAAAGDSLTVLAHARILGLHSVVKLYAALHSDRCVSCGAYGAFLHILSAERCCFMCLVFNQSLRMISLPAAKECFSLTNQHLKSLPFMWSIPGEYSLPDHTSQKRSIRLACVRAVKELAIKVHGSLEALAERHPLDAEPLPRFPPFKAALYRWYRQAPLQQLSLDPLIMPLSGSRPRDPYGGMGALYFPSLLGGSIENGRWCLECELAYDKYVFDEMEPSVLARIVPEGVDADQYLMRMQYRAWSTAEFIEHAKHTHCKSEDALQSRD
jgi:hypothetical protein